MESDYNILKQITPENANPYLIPIGYFEGLASAILLKINGNQNIYQIPENYFAGLSNSILGKIKQETDVEVELQEIAPLLNKINKQNVYTIQSNYFENVKLINPDLGKTGSLKNRNFSWLRYAVAAALIGVFSFGALKLLNKPASIENDLQASIQNISDSDLKNELDSDKFSIASIEEAALITPWQSIADLQEEIKYIPDEEIEVYINDNNIIDVATNSSNS